jgi:hypothetical protein
MSGLPPTDIARPQRHVRKVPKTGSRGELIQSPRRRGEQQRRHDEASDSRLQIDDQFASGGSLDR